MKQLRIQTFMHVPFEGLGCIETWTKKHNHKVTFTRFYEHIQLPQTDEIDMLIVMGGPMSVYEENIYPWLKLEKDFIRKAIEKGKIVLGICLGSQLIAAIAIGVFAGIKADEWLSISPVLTCALPLLILASFFYKLFKETSSNQKK